MLAYKGDWYGCQVEKVNRWHPSSKTCSACGAVMEAMPLHVHEWQCPVCDLVHDRDVNAVAMAAAIAASTILNQSTVGATGSHACGQSVRPDIAAAIGQRWMNQEANLL